MIKEVTGHSSDCVRTYKRTSCDIRELASNTIAGENTENSVKEQESSKLVEVKTDKNNIKCNNVTESDQNLVTKTNKQGLSMMQMIKNVLKTKAEIARKKVTSTSKYNKCKRLLAKKILKQTKAKKLASQLNQSKGKITIDLNVNVHIKK